MNNPNQARRTITLERTYAAPLADVWALWTTKAGIESWWGPEGFSVEVNELDLRPGGALQYTMTAVAPAQIGFMQQAGLPLATAAKLTFTEIKPQLRLAFVHFADFIPNVTPYNVATVVDLSAESQLGKAAKVLQRT
jgi:uncharacterized protein YndB with AHSA1/START domain